MGNYNKELSDEKFKNVEYGIDKINTKLDSFQQQIKDQSDLVAKDYVSKSDFNKLEIELKEDIKDISSKIETETGYRNEDVKKLYRWLIGTLVTLFVGSGILKFVFDYLPIFK